uniref:AMP-binding enzyme n=1 Tax=Aquimarina algiphila TaxID=2047982 RepID=UPI0038B2B13D
RVELGEIEYHLLSHHSVEDAIVLYREDIDGEGYLVAYVVVDGDQTSTSLRDHLRLLLPEYMVPSYYVSMDSFPLTSNGKVDKKSLPSPEGIGMDRGVEYVGARNDLESELVSIWEEVLGREGIGVKDDFFE